MQLCARIAALLFAILFWVLFALKLIADWIGRTTVVDDFNQLVERMPAIVGWLVATPWWVPGGLAAMLTAFLIWAGWPTDRPRSGRLSRKQRYASLGVDALHVASQIEHFQHIGKFVGGSGTLHSEILAIMVRFHDQGFPIPPIAKDATQDERLDSAFKFLSVMGVLLRDGSVAEARAISRDMYTESLQTDVGGPNRV